MKSHILGRTAVVAIALLTAACSDGQANRDASASSEERIKLEDSPVKWSSPQPEVIALPNSQILTWSEIVARQADQDQQYLEQLNSRYFGAMAFDSMEERKFLLRSGFPLPEEWIEARRMTDSQLRSAADSGDRKAAGMYADRMAVRFSEMLALDKVDPDAVRDRDRASVAALAVNYAHMASEGARGAFGVYVQGMVKSKIYGTPEPMTAAMFRAMALGDPRTGRLIRDMSNRYPCQRVEDIHGLMANLDAKR